MNDVSVAELADKVADLMEARLRVRGVGLAVKLRRGGRLLPRRVRREAEVLLRASEQAQVPKLRVQLDRSRIEAAFAACTSYLMPLGGAARRRALFLDIFETVGMAVFFFLTGIVVFLIWQGLV